MRAEWAEHVHDPNWAGPRKRHAAFSLIRPYYIHFYISVLLRLPTPSRDSTQSLRVSSLKMGAQISREGKNARHGRHGLLTSLFKRKRNFKDLSLLLDDDEKSAPLADEESTVVDSDDERDEYFRDIMEIKSAHLKTEAELESRLDDEDLHSLGSSYSVHVVKDEENSGECSCNPLKHRKQDEKCKKKEKKKSRDPSFKPLSRFEEIRLHIIRIFRRDRIEERPNEEEVEEIQGVEKEESRTEIVTRWLQQIWPDFQGPLPPLISTIGITESETILLSSVIDQVTQPTNAYAGFRQKVLTKPFLMLHQTNEEEIMSTIGSFRLNPWLKATKDVDSIAYENVEDSLFKNIFYWMENERNRRWSAFSRQHRALSLKDAYAVGEGRFLAGQKPQFGIAEIVREQQKRCERISQLPVVNTIYPVVGVPFKGYFRDVVDSKEASIEMLQAMNQHLQAFAVQIIDLRCRSEEVVGQPPIHVHERSIVNEATDAIVRSVGTLRALQNTAKYFVVYAFYSCSMPMRFFQMVVRFKPGLPINPVDFVDDGKSRLQIDEPDLQPRNNVDNVWWMTDVSACKRDVANKKRKYLEKLARQERLEELKRKQEEIDRIGTRK